MNAVRVCDGPGCATSLDGRRPQTRVCSGRCQKALERERAKAPGAEVLLQRELAALEYVRVTGDPDAWLDALDAVTDPEGFREEVRRRAA